MQKTVNHNTGRGALRHDDAVRETKDYTQEFEAHVPTYANQILHYYVTQPEGHYVHIDKYHQTTLALCGMKRG